MMEVVDQRARVEDAYRRIHPRLWKALLSFTGDRELASDAESEAFAQALRRGAAVDDVAAWVWRSAFRIAAGMLVDAPPNVHVRRDDAQDDSLAEFLSLLSGLSEQQRACVVLRYVGGFDAAAIAGLLDTSPGTVRVQLHRAHASLRRTIRETTNG